MQKRLVCAVCAMVLVGSVAGAQQETPLPKVIPAPRHMQWAAGAPAWLEMSGLDAYVLSASCRGIEGGIEQVDARLRTLSLAPLPVRTQSNITAASASGGVFLTVQPDDACEAMVSDLPEPGAEGYRLLVTPDAVFIVGKDLPGLYYGLVTLSRLIEKQGRIPRVAISDWPDMRLRGTYIGGSSDWPNRIRGFASLKLNLVQFESSEFYLLDDPEVRSRWQDIFALCRRHFIEPVPELQSLGWGHFILRQEPRAAEGVYIEKQPFQVADGRVQSPDPPIAPALEIANPGFEQADGDVVAGWTQEQPGKGTLADREGAHAGQGCVRIACAERTVMRVWQDVDCLPDRRYEVSCFMKTQDIAGGTAYIEVYGLQPSRDLGELIGREAPKLGGTTDWTRAATAFDTAGYARLRIYVRIQDATGTAWFDDVAIAGVPSPNPLANVLVTEVSPVVVQDETGNVTYEEGKDYALRVPQIEYPYESGDPLGIEVLPEGRIADGDTVLLSYNHAPGGSITCCPSEPLYQAFMRKAVHNTVSCLKPKYLHIGHDEPRVMNRDKRCTDRGLSSAEIFVDDIKKMRAYAREVDPNIRVMMWDDAVNPYQNAPAFGMEKAAESIPKDIVMCIWWYSESNVEKQIEASTKYFLDLGFDITGSPWFNPNNAYRWAETLYRHGKGNPHVLGDLYTSWAHPSADPWGALATTAEYAWTIDQPPFEASQEP